MDLKQIDALIKLCRKAGVTDISVDGITLKLSPEAPKSNYKKRVTKAAPDPFEQAMAEAKDAATRAKLKYMSENQKQLEQRKAQVDVNGAPDELAMLLWSAGGGDGAPEERS